MTQDLLILLKKLNGKTFTITAITVVIIGLFWFYGCESKVASVQDPNQRVTRAELEAEIAYFNAKAQARISTLDQQDKLKKMLLEQVAVISTGGTFNPVGALNSIISILAVGYAVDSRKKLANANKTRTTPAT